MNEISCERNFAQKMHLPARIVLGVLFVFVAVVPSVCGQTPESVTCKYDKFQDYTETLLISSSSTVLIPKVTNALYFGVAGVYLEKTPPRPPLPVSFLFVSVHPMENDLEGAELILLLDDERVRVGRAKNKNRKNAAGGLQIQNLSIEMDLSILIKIAYAKSAEGKLGDKEFVFTSMHKNLLNAFATKYLSPCAS